MDLGLGGRVALVVGGGGLVGAAVARVLAGEGATVVLAGRTRATLDDAAAALADAASDRGDGGGRVDVEVLDSTDDDSVAAGVAAVVQRHGRVDVLVNCAAPAAQTLDADRHTDPAQVTWAFETKAMGYLRCANAVLPAMTEAGWGRIVNVSGQNAYLTANLTGAVRNGAVGILAKVLADGAAGSGVTVNTVHPGLVSPDLAAGEVPDVEPGTPGASSPEQVAAVVAFLCSEAAGAVSGESVAVGHRVRGVSAY